MGIFRNVIAAATLSLAALVKGACVSMPETANGTASPRVWPTDPHALRERIETVEDAWAFQDSLEYDYERLEAIVDGRDGGIRSPGMLSALKKGICSDAAVAMTLCLADDFEDVLYTTISGDVALPEGGNEVMRHAIAVVHDNGVWKSAGINDYDEQTATSLVGLVEKVARGHGCKDASFSAYELGEGLLSTPSLPPGELEGERVLVHRYERGEFQPVDRPLELRGRMSHRVREGNYSGAIADFEEIVGLEPDESYAYVLRGKIYEEQQNWEAASAMYTKVLEIEKRIFKGCELLAYGRRARCRIELGDFEGALADIESKESSYFLPGDLFSRARAYMGLGEYGKALADMNNIISDDIWHESTRAKARGLKEQIRSAMRE